MSHGNHDNITAKLIDDRQNPKKRSQKDDYEQGHCIFKK